MNRLLLGSIVFAFFASSCAFAQDVCSFSPTPPSRDEARTLALGGVMPEWKCDYDLGALETKDQNTFLLLAELYDGTKCVRRYRLALPVIDPSKPQKGVLAVSWRASTHELTGVVDDGLFYGTWTDGAIALPSFSPTDYHFFATSHPEPRHGQDGDCRLFPILGIRGDSSLKTSYLGVATANDFLRACVRSHSKGAVLIYIYKGAADPPLHFDRT